MKIVKDRIPKNAVVLRNATCRRIFTSAPNFCEYFNIGSSSKDRSELGLSRIRWAEYAFRWDHVRFCAGHVRLNALSYSWKIKPNRSEGESCELLWWQGAG